MSVPWTLRVMRAFRDAMNDNKPAEVPTAYIGWPDAAMAEGPYVPFVWFAGDPTDWDDGRETHRGLEVVTGVVFRRDAGKTTETELEQAIAAYYALRSILAAAMGDDQSQFNSQFEGLAQPHPEHGGVTPTAGKDFDSTSVIGERWLVRGSAKSIGAADA